jgi:hypothetical protein
LPVDAVPNLSAESKTFQNKLSSIFFSGIMKQIFTVCQKRLAESKPKREIVSCCSIS